MSITLLANLLSLLSMITISIGSWVYILTWKWRQKTAGALLLNIGEITFNKTIFWLGILAGLMALFPSFMSIIEFFMIVTPPAPPGMLSIFLKDLIASISLWASASASIYISSTGWELRENGICYFFWFSKWQTYRSYTWKGANNSLLLLQYKSRFFIIRKLENITIPIPTKHGSAVDQILIKYLPKVVGKS